MLTRRVAVAANAGAIVMLVAVMALNVMQARAEGNIGEILSGPEAIAHRREVAEARAGELTPERVAADIARYQEIAYERLNPEELADMSDAAAYEAVAEAYDEATRLELYDPYYITLLKPWAVRGLGSSTIRTTSRCSSPGRSGAWSPTSTLSALPPRWRSTSSPSSRPASR